MFDVGFSELLVIGIVALLVIGPEKLPKVARTVGALLGRMQRYVNDVKADINREMELDELKNLRTTVQDAASSIEASVNQTMSGFQSQADELNKIALGETPPEAPAPTNPVAAVPDKPSSDAGSAASDAPVLTAASDVPAALQAMPPSPAPSTIAPVAESPVQTVFHQDAQASLALEETPISVGAGAAVAGIKPTA